MIGFEARTFFSTWVSSWAPARVAKYLMAYLADTVLPAPDSPLTMMDWFSSNLCTHVSLPLKSVSSIPYQLL